MANKQNLLLFAIIALFLVLKWGYLGAVFAAFFLLPGLAVIQYTSQSLSDEAKLALSFPVSLMLTSGLMFSLHRAGLDLPVDWFAIIPIAAIGGLILNRSKFEIKLGSKEQIIAIVIFLLFLNTFYSALQKDAVPRTDGSNHLYKTWVTLQGMEKYGKILEWSKYMYSGHTLFVFYPPLAYVSPAMLTHFAGVPVHKAFNFFAFWAVLYAGLGVYLLAKKVGVTELLSGSAAIILITTPSLLGKVFFQGSYAIVLAFSFFAIMAFLGLDLKGKSMFWLAFPIAAVLMTHSLIFYYAAYLVVGIAAWLFFVRKEKTEGKFVVAALLIAALLSSSWLLPFLKEFRQMHLTEGQSKVNILEFIHQVTYYPKNAYDCLDKILECTQSFTPVFWIMFLLGVLSLYTIQKTNNKIFVLFCFLVILFIVFSEMSFFVKILPFREKIIGGSGGYRMYFFILPFFSIVSIFIIDLINEKIKLKYLAYLLLLIIIFKSTEFWLPAPNIWMSETAPLGGVNAPELYSAINQLGDARIITFGMYGGGIVTGIPIMTGHDVFSGWGYETAGDIQTEIYKIQSIDFTLNSTLSPQEALNIFERTNTKFFVIDRCDTEGERFGKTILLPMPSNYSVLWIGNITKNGMGLPCVSITQLNDPTNFIEYADTKKAVPYDRSQEAIRAALPASGEILVKESYFPNWNAYLNDKKIEIKKTEIGYMKFYADGAGQLQLKYELNRLDRLSGFIGFSFLIIFITTLVKKEI